MSSGGVDSAAARYDNLFALRGWSFKSIGLTNTVYSETALPFHLPSLPPFCGAIDHELQSLFDDQPRNSLNNRSDLLPQAGTISELLRDTDVSYLSFISESNWAGTLRVMQNLVFLVMVLWSTCTIGIELNLEETTHTVQNESTTPKDNQGKSKRKLAFDVHVPRKRRTKTSGRGPRQRSSPVEQAQSLPDGPKDVKPSPKSSHTAESDPPINTSQPSHWLLMLSYKILSANDPHLATALTKIASSMDDSKWDLLGSRLELVKLQAELREAKEEASKAKEEARIMGEEVKVVKNDMEKQVKVALEISNPNILLVRKDGQVTQYPVGPDENGDPPSRQEVHPPRSECC